MDLLKKEVNNYIKLGDCDKLNKYNEIKKRVSDYEKFLNDLSDKLECPDKYYHMLNNITNNILTDDEFKIYTDKINEMNKINENSEDTQNIEVQILEYINLHYMTFKCREYLANQEMKIIIKN